LIQQEDAVGLAVLKNLGIQKAAIRAAVEGAMQANPAESLHEIVPTSRVKRVIELAFEEARRDKSNGVGTGHLLVALMSEKDGIAAQVLREQTLTIDSVRAELARLHDAGVAEPVGGLGRPAILLRHLDLADEQGKSIAIDIVFPPDYSEQQCTEVASRIQSAVQGRQS
jgi:ATP-dependent Clp protease ATP-binding subunit ClpC